MYGSVGGSDKERAADADMCLFTRKHKAGILFLVQIEVFEKLD